MNSQPNLKPFMIKGFINILTGKAESIELVKNIEQQTDNKPKQLVNNPTLVEFVKQNNISEVKKLLDEGCDPNVKNLGNEGCLEFAIERNNLDMVKLLVAAGANIEEKNCSYYKMSALNYACHEKKKEIAEYLISIGADIDSVENGGWCDTPLHNACRGQVHSEIIIMLLKKGADYTKSNRNGRTPLEIANLLDKKEAAKLIEDFIKSKEEKAINVEKPSTINPENTVQPSVEAPKVVEKIKNPKLLEFVIQNNISEVKKLLDEGCDPNVEKNNEIGCVSYAICNDNLDMIKLLVNAGVNIEQKNCCFIYKMSPLNYACYKKKKEIAEYLIGLGADINSDDRDGDTSLHNAVRDGFCPEVIKLLLEKNADYTKKNNDRKTSLELAKQLGKHEAANLIENFIKSKEENVVKSKNTTLSTVEAPKIAEKIKNPTLVEFVKNNNISEVKKLLDEGCDPNVKDPFGGGCLEFAIEHNNLDMVKLLVAAGANIEEKNCSTINKMSALNFACYKKKKEIAEYLISIGANVNSEDNDDDTPLHNSCRGFFVIEIINKLLKNGADYTKKNRFKDTPLDFAKRINKKEIVKLLKKHIKSKEEKLVKAENPNAPKNTNLVKLSLDVKGKPVNIECCYEDAVKFFKEFNQ